MFMVVDASPSGVKLGKVAFMGSAHAIGSWVECARWQLATGMRGTTEIIPF